MNKKILTVFVVFSLLILAGVVYFFSRNNGNTPTTTKLPTPELTGIINIETEKIILDINEDLSLPSKASLLQTNTPPTISENDISIIASNLGFQDQSSINEDYNLGKVHVFSTGSKSLVIYSDASSINYSNPTADDVINKQLSEGDKISIAENFLINEFGLDPKVIKFVNVIPLTASSQGEIIYNTPENSSDFVQVNFSPIIDDLPVITLNPRNTPYYVWVTPDGSIQNAVANNTGDLVNTSDPVALKSIEEISNSLDQAIIVNLDQGNIHLPSINSQYIENIVISDIKLAYLSEESDILQPIYLLTGKANLLDPKREVDAVLYMPAISNPS